MTVVLITARPLSHSFTHFIFILHVPLPIWGRGLNKNKTKDDSRLSQNYNGAKSFGGIRKTRSLYSRTEYTGNAVGANSAACSSELSVRLFIRVMRNLNSNFFNQLSINLKPIMSNINVFTLLIPVFFCLDLLVQISLQILHHSFPCKQHDFNPLPDDSSLCRREMVNCLGMVCHLSSSLIV